MLKPMNGHLLVQVIEKEARTASGIYIPSTASANEPKRAKVLAVADDTTGYAYGDVVHRIGKPTTDTVMVVNI